MMTQLSRSPYALVAALMLVTNNLSASGSQEDAADQSPNENASLERRVELLEEENSRATNRILAVTEIQPKISATSNRLDSDSGLFASRSSWAQLKQLEALQVVDGTWRIAHQSNASGNFSLVRRLGARSDSLTLSFDEDDVTTLDTNQTVSWRCTSGEARQVRIASEQGKTIYVSEAKCGDSITVKDGTPQ